MKIYVLIMAIWSGPFTTQEFNSLETCEKAKQVVMERERRSTYAACVEK